MQKTRFFTFGLGCTVKSNLGKFWDSEQGSSKSVIISVQNALELVKLGSEGKILCKKVDFSLLGGCPLKLKFEMPDMRVLTTT
jgi:hypothetical protein